jgi:hypothetical protein
LRTLKHLSIPLSLFLFLIIINLQVVRATSETFPLSPMQTLTRNVELQKNDRLVGSFTITNLQTWTNGFGDVQSYSVSVTIFDPTGQVVLSYTNTKGDSFDYTAFYAGVYTIQFSVGFEYLPPSGIEKPQATLNYNVVQSQPSLLGNLPSWLIPLIIAIILSGVIAIVAYYMKARETKNKRIRNTS